MENRDLGGAAKDIRSILAAASKQAPRGSRVLMSGQVATMSSSFVQMGLGLIFAIVLVIAHSRGVRRGRLAGDHTEQVPPRTA